MAVNTDRGQRVVVLVGVVIVHGLAFVFLTIGLRGKRIPYELSDSPSQLIFIPESDAGARTTQRPVVEPTLTRRAESQSQEGAGQRKVSDELQPSTAVTMPQSVDWYEQGQAANAKQLERTEQARKQRQFAASDRPRSIPKAKEIQRSEIDWDPLHGKRIGLTDEGVFFVKLSDKCIIVAVFLACQFGGKIHYNGDLFKNVPAKLDAARESEVP